MADAVLLLVMEDWAWIVKEAGAFHSSGQAPSGSGRASAWCKSHAGGAPHQGEGAAGLRGPRQVQICWLLWRQARPGRHWKWQIQGSTGLCHRLLLQALAH